MTKIPIQAIIAAKTGVSIEDTHDWGEEEWDEVIRILRKSIADKNKSK